MFDILQMRATMSLYRRGGREEEGREERHARACTSLHSCKESWK